MALPPIPSPCSAALPHCSRLAASQTLSASITRDISSWRGAGAAGGQPAALHLSCAD